MNEKRRGIRFLGASLAALVAVAAGAAEPAYVNGARVDGATPGEWTHDWDAATAAARKDGKPVFVNFTGSDWCPWCKVLERQVFSQAEWGAWASNHVYLVRLDFPNDKSLVPEKYRDRNRELARRYKVSGYPTCYLLDSAALDEPIGRFGASRDATPSNFIEKVSAKMPGERPDAPAGIESSRRNGQGAVVSTNDFKAVLTGVAVVDDKRRHAHDEATFVPPETKVAVPYGKTALFRVEYDFPEGYAARVWTLDGRCDDGKLHTCYFGSNPSGMFKGRGTAYGFLSLLERGKTCRVRELLLKTGAAPELDHSPREWTMATVPVDIEFLERPAGADASPDGARASAPAPIGDAGRLPAEKLPAEGVVAKFVFDDENKANDLAKAGRKFQVGGVPPRWNSFRSADDLVTNGALRVSGEYEWEALPHLDVPELRYDRFAVAMDFLPRSERGSWTPLVSFGRGWRWFHVLLRGDGTPVVSFRGLEKGDFERPLPGSIHQGEWNWIVVSFDVAARRVSVALNGRRIPDVALPPDFAFRFSREDREKSRTVQFANCNNGTVFKGDVGGFLLFDRALTDEELDAIAVAPGATTGPWTFRPDEEGDAFYWNGSVSDGSVTLDARLADGEAAVSFPEVLSVPRGTLDLRRPVLAPDGTEVPLVGIGSAENRSHVGFGGCRRDATEVRLPASLRYFGPGAFERFLSLERIDCPDSLRSIGSAAFHGCRSLRRFALGRGVEVFSSDRVFTGCDALEAIEVDPRNRSFKAVDEALLTADGRRLVAFPPGRKGPFAVPAGVEEVPARAFLGCRGLTRVSVPASVKRIGEYAFADCPALERIEFEDRSFRLDDRAFGSGRDGERVRRPATNLANE